MIPLDEVLHFDLVLRDPDSRVVSDADSTPTFDVFEEATDTPILAAQNLTKRTSLTGHYRGSFTVSTANGFEVAKFYSVVVSATVNGYSDKDVTLAFRCAAAEAQAGYPKVDTQYVEGAAPEAADDVWASATRTLTATSDSAGVTTLLSRIPSGLFTGITSLAQWLGLIAGKQTGNSTARTEVRATGAGSGTFDETTDSQEAIRDNQGTAQTGDAYARLGAPAGASTSADIAAVKVDTAAILDDTGTAGVVVASGSKTGYALSSAGIQAIWDALTSALTTVGSIGKLLVDNINATISSRLPTSSYTAPPSVGAIADQVWEETLADHSGTAGSTAAAVNAAGSAGDPWGTALPGAYGAGSAGKIIGDNLNATVSSRSSHSAADIWAVGTRTLTSFGTLVADIATAVWGATTRLLTAGTNIVLAKGTGVTGFNDPTAATTASAVRTEIATELARVDVATSTRLASGSYTAPPSAATNASAVRTELSTELGRLDAAVSTRATPAQVATELGTYDAPTKAELDAAIATVLAAVPSAASNASAFLDASNGVETSITPRQALRLILAASAGKLSGAATATIVIRNVGDSKNRITASVDADGNRSAVTIDAT